MFDKVLSITLDLTFVENALILEGKDVYNEIKIVIKDLDFGLVV